MLKSLFTICAQAVLFLILLPIAGYAASSSSGSTFPDKPIRLILPQGVGSSTDNVLRVLQPRLSSVLGQQIVIDNRPGASGKIGIQLAGQATPDGYTLLATSTGIHVISPQLRSDKTFVAMLRAMEPISLCVVTQNSVTVSTAVPVRTLREFINYAKSRPGKLNMASAGLGTQSHIAGVQFMQLAGIKAVHVPYKGGGPLYAALVTNESQFAVAPLSGVLSHVRAGRMRALATTGAKRSTQLPSVPTTTEAGLPEFRSNGWVGLLAPKGTPKPLLDKLHSALLAVINEPETRHRIERLGAEPHTTTREGFARFIASEWDRYGQIIEKAGIKVE